MRLFVFFIYLEQDNDPPTDLQHAAVNLLSTYVNFVNAEVQFPCKTWLHCIDFATQVDDSFDKELTKLGEDIYIWDPLNLRFFLNFGVFFLTNLIH